jgi:hypothetical protein
VLHRFAHVGQELPAVAQTGRRQARPHARGVKPGGVGRGLLPHQQRPQVRLLRLRDARHVGRARVGEREDPRIGVLHPREPGREGLAGGADGVDAAVLGPAPDEDRGTGELSGDPRRPQRVDLVVGVEDDRARVEQRRRPRGHGLVGRGLPPLRVVESLANQGDRAHAGGGVGPEPPLPFAVLARPPAEEPARRLERRVDRPRGDIDPGLRERGVVRGRDGEEGDDRTGASQVPAAAFARVHRDQGRGPEPHATQGVGGGSVEPAGVQGVPIGDDVDVPVPLHRARARAAGAGRGAGDLGLDEGVDEPGVDVLPRKIPDAGPGGPRGRGHRVLAPHAHDQPVAHDDHAVGDEVGGVRRSVNGRADEHMGGWVGLPGPVRGGGDPRLGEGGVGEEHERRERAEGEQVHRGSLPTAGDSRGRSRKLFGNTRRTGPLRRTYA